MNYADSIYDDLENEHRWIAQCTSDCIQYTTKSYENNIWEVYVFPDGSFLRYHKATDRFHKGTYEWLKWFIELLGINEGN